MLDMKKHTSFIFVLVIGGLGILYAMGRLSSDLAASGQWEVILDGPQKHLVTPEMLDATGKMARRPAPAFRAEATDGITYCLDEVKGEQPLVLLFIKDGCPCSQAAQPFFNRLHDAYGSRVRFFGIIDTDVEVARNWEKQNRVPFPILSDPELKIVHEYKAENSAYLVLVARGGAIEEYWPGYSAGMLREASKWLAQSSGCEVKSIDLTDAPEELYSGCPF